MKKKEKELTKKARKQIQRSLEDLLTDEIKKAITGQGRNPKKAAKEIKRSASLIAKTLAQKESLSKPAKESSAPETAKVRERVKSFEIPPIPAPEIPAVAELPATKAGRVGNRGGKARAEAEAEPGQSVKRGRKPAGKATAEAEATPVQPAKRGRKPAGNTTAEAESVPARAVRKRAPRQPLMKVESTIADEPIHQTEEVLDTPSTNEENTD